MQQRIYDSLKRFLFKKNFINEAVADQGGWPLEAHKNYVSYMEHRLSVRTQLVPINLEQIDPRILDDADWLFLDEDNQDETTEPVIAAALTEEREQVTSTPAVAETVVDVKKDGSFEFEVNKQEEKLEEDSGDKDDSKESSDSKSDTGKE